MKEIILNVNGVNHRIDIHEEDRLIDVLREKLYLTGTKEGCGEGECGACTVIIDGETVNACMILAFQGEGRKIITIEGLNRNDGLHPIQQAFLEEGAVQCGFCIPGMVLSAKVVLDKNPSPSRGEIRESISGNLCRCTGYNKIVDAIERASRLLKEESL
ncbi:(2Fe-2S)-binding protein [Alkaliphilus oremlandii]|uniref:(2Fe-2S)-binding domain protein n=1 Tax=Alkaliphilus oremlandii (strain OhILAs) TaxID=350688 RepID=A8MLM1_ALKOO|nr:(2Fe-2S)-binding protein [Alkaliphilus oremlandii]ABW17938.1 (2Fe-2S)-binding domain protein [Alkaliphilus oremlandii OhILAs]